MAQFTVYRNKNPHTHPAVPFLLDLQNDLLADLETRVVVPLCPFSAVKGQTLRTLMPVLEIEGERFVMLTPQMAGIPKSELGAPVTRVEQHRFAIIAATFPRLTPLHPPPSRGVAPPTTSLIPLLSRFAAQ